MKNTSENNQNDHPGNERMDLEIVARIKGKDGTMIEKTVRIDGAIPNVYDFDLSTKDRFLKDLGELEQAVLSARNQMAEGLAENYLGTVSKKTGIRRNSPRRTSVETEIWKDILQTASSLAALLMPKEHLYSHAFEEILCRFYSSLSYRKSCALLNAILHRLPGMELKISLKKKCRPCVWKRVSMNRLPVLMRSGRIATRSKWKL